jgi:caffeoyl-CoA O-methyltransferase
MVVSPLVILRYYISMFHNIPQTILDRMAELESADANDRLDGTPRLQRLRQIPPETGRFLALMAASAPEGTMLEIGTSAGYSALWISLALQERSVKLYTFEVLPAKVELARETFRKAQVEDHVELIHADARQHLHEYGHIAFCFLDAEKEIYADCYDLVVPNLTPGGLLLVDNVISHQADLQPFIDRAYADPRVDAVVISIGKGLLLCRKGIR